MKIAIVGATGLVGREMLRVVEETFAADKVEIIAVASEKSQGNKLRFRDGEISIVSMENALAQKPQIAVFSAGSQVSRQYAPQFVAIGATVVDNSSAWRMEKNVPLIVPEINADILTKNDKIIANPNCSTAQMVLVLNPLYRKYGIRRLVVSTYQSVTGTGSKAVQQILNERSGVAAEKVYPHPIDLNLFPHGGNFLENDYTDEEMKLLNETQKIFGDSSIAITATVVRVPVMGGHSEAVNVEFCNEFDLEEVKKMLQNAPGVVVQDDPKNNMYPTPLFAQGKNEVFVGRIRRDESQPKSLNLWIVADNLRKGAATNAIQIASYLIENHLI